MMRSSRILVAAAVAIISSAATAAAAALAVSSAVSPAVLPLVSCVPCCFHHPAPGRLRHNRRRLCGHGHRGRHRGTPSGRWTVLSLSSSGGGSDDFDDDAGDSAKKKLLLDAILDPSASPQQYGMPVGVVRLPAPYIQSFRDVCEKALPHLGRIRFRGVDPCCPPAAGTVGGDGDDTTQMGMEEDEEEERGREQKGKSGKGTFKEVHVPTEVTVAIVLDGNEAIIEYIRDCGGTYVPGARRRRGRRRVRGSGKYLDGGGSAGSNTATASATSATATTSSSAPPPPGTFTFVELFAGIGGFRLGLEPLGGRCVLASERDEVACAIYRRQFGVDYSGSGDDDHLVEGDMIDIVSDDFPAGGFDVLTAGFPCQPFSARGEQRGLDDEDHGHRGQLYQELVRVLMEQRPNYFLFENVVGLVKMDGGIASHWTGRHVFEAGRVMEVILEAFRSCGYKVEWHVVNSKHFVPQHRERVYFFGSRAELDCPDMEWDNIYPPPHDRAADGAPTVLREYLETDHATSAAVAECELTERQWDMVKRKCNGDATERLRLKVEEESAPTLISSYRTPASVSTRFVMEEADGTLRHGDPLRPRFLTPVEFRRLMGFPESFDVSPLYEGGGVGHIYQVLGNAVVPPVIEAIGREMLRLMEHVEAREKSD